jgi:carbamoyl-phosphate synthase large subunit
MFYSDLDVTPTLVKPIRCFVRQPLTESGAQEKLIVQEVLDLFVDLPYSLEIITGLVAQTRDTFRYTFENTTGLAFTPQKFRAARLKLLNEADAMIVIRTGLSESGAFEVAYNLFGGGQIPMFFAIWHKAPIKTTLLRDLEDLCAVKYVNFERPEELIEPLSEFFGQIAEFH